MIRLYIVLNSTILYNMRWFIIHVLEKNERTSVLIVLYLYNKFCKFTNMCSSDDVANKQKNGK